MNGIISIADGAGGTMEDGVVTCLELDVPRINVDQIESKTVGANVSLYTELTSGSIHLANANTTLYINSATVGSTSFTSPYMQNVSMNSSLLNVSVVNISSVAIGTENVSTLNVSTLNASTLTTNTITALNSSSTANLFTNVSTGSLNIGTQMNTLSTINIGQSSVVNFSQSTINSAGGINASNLFCDNFRHEVYGTNVSLLLEYFGPSATIQMGNVSNRLIIYAPTTIVDSLKTQTIISPNPTILSDLFANNTTGNVSIATGLTTGILTLGGAGVVNIKGSAVNISTLNTSSLNVSTLNTNTIAATSSSSNAVIYNNITSGSLQLATNSSTVSIGTNSSTVSIGYNASKVEVANLRFAGSELRTIDSASSLTIGGANMSSTQIIAIGTSQNNVYFGSTGVGANMFVGDFRFTNDTLNLMVGSAPNVSGTLKLGDALTVGSLQLGTGLTTGNVSLGSNSMSGTFNLMTGGILLLGESSSSISLATTPSIANAVNVGNVSSTFFVNSSSANISSKALTLGASASNISMGTSNTAGVVNIGVYTAGVGSNLTLSGLNFNVSAGAINLGSTSANTNTISIGNVSTTSLTLNTPINPNYDTKYTAYTGSPTGCIGNVMFATNYFNILAMTTNVASVSNNFLSIPVGVYILNWYNEIRNTGANSIVTATTMSVGTVSGASNIVTLRQIGIQNITLGAGREIGGTVTQVVTVVSGTQNLYCSVIMTFAGGTIVNQGSTYSYDCTLTRIA